MSLRDSTAVRQNSIDRSPTVGTSWFRRGRGVCRLTRIIGDLTPDSTRNLAAASASSHASSSSSASMPSLCDESDETSLTTPETPTTPKQDTLAGLDDLFSELAVLHAGPRTPPSHQRGISANSEILTTPASASTNRTPRTSRKADMTAEGNDHLAPLPDRSPRMSRPDFHRQTSLPVPSHPSTPPSPHAMGISELLCGSPFPAHPKLSYFSGAVQSEPSVPRLGSPSRRPPAYSPFRSFYGEFPGSHRRAVSVDHSPLVGLDNKDDDDDRPERADIPVNTGRSALSDTGVSVSSVREEVKGPRVRNGGAILAPHGSFTSARPRSVISNSPPSSVASSDSGSRRSTDTNSVIGRDEMEVEERNALERSAAKGDQLAVYRLGRTESPNAPRHTIGSVENVWGASWR